MIDPRAIVSDEATIAEDVEIGPYSIIGAEVEIASGTVVGPHAVIQGPTRIGRDNRIYQFASVGDAPQDKKYAGEPTRLEIGDRNTIREFCTINRGTVGDRGVTRIGDDNWFMAYVHIAHDCIVGDQSILANCATLGGHVTLGDWVIMGGFSGIHQFCQVGEHSFIGNNAAVTRDVPTYLMVSGQPAEPKGINSEGLKRRGFTPQQIKNIRAAYKIIYRSGLKLQDAIARLEESSQQQSELEPMLHSLHSATRSIVR